MIHFAWPLASCILILLIPALIWVRLHMRKVPRYRRALGARMNARGFASNHVHKKFFFLSRCATLVGLALLIGMPQIIDYRSQIRIEGIDIALVIDASGSMNFPSSPGDYRSRFEVAKEEAQRFVDKREHDSFALVFFGDDAISRSPVTPDRRIVNQMISDAEIGTLVNPEGTRLFSAMITAANRLRHSHAKSKIMILLTDGSPSNDPIEAHTALAVVKELGIKVYTVGIGDDGANGYVTHPLFGRVPKELASQLVLNTQLLQFIAHETGGAFFLARDARDMRKIYDDIDKLERSVRQVPLYSRRHDIFMPFAAGLAGLVVAELFFSTFVWFGLAL